VVEYFYKHYEICDWFRQLLKSSSDLERELQKVAIGNASLMDLVSVLNTLKIAQEISLYLDDEVLTSLKDELNGLQEFPELIHELTNAINKEEMTIATGYSLQMDSIREELLNNTNTVHMMADSIIKNYGINKLNVSSHKQYGRVFETTRVQSKKLDKHLIKVDQTQSAVRFLTPELQILNTRYQELSNEYEQMERTICSKLLDKIMDNMKELKLLAKSLANLDVAMTLANVARLKGYSRPVIVCDPIYNVIGGYHPVLADTTQVVPNDCHMSPDSSNVHIITGPNMGGKSTFLRQMALLSILGQMGSFVPVKTAKLGVVDRLFARIGASDNIVKQMSTFYVEMNETSHILANATSQSLILMDEIGRGTATNEGVALARSIVEYIHDSIGGLFGVFLLDSFV
jgi:DNA mismatch repair protein MutS